MNNKQKASAHSEERPGGRKRGGGGGGSSQPRPRGPGEEAGQVDEQPCGLSSSSLLQPRARPRLFLAGAEFSCSLGNSSPAPRQRPAGSFGEKPGSSVQAGAEREGPRSSRELEGYLGL